MECRINWQPLEIGDMLYATLEVKADAQGQHERNQFEAGLREGSASLKPRNS
jgi:hypothetical protein